VGGELVVCGWAERPFEGARDGPLVDLDAASGVFAEVLGAAQRQGGISTRRVVAGISGPQVRLVRARGDVRVKTPVTLTTSHLRRAVEAAADIGLPDDHEILHVLPTGYQVDGARAVRRPLGMRARWLTAEAAIVIVASFVLDNLQRALEAVGYELVGAVAEPLAAARGALTADDRKSGAVLLDVGAQSLGAAVYRDEVVQGLATVQAGSAHVSRDVAYALHLELPQAEALKRRSGVALAESVSHARQVEVQRGRERLFVSQQMLASVIEARMEELFVMARDALRGQRALALRDRVVLVGGGARLAGTVELAEQVFEAPARLGAPVANRGWREAAGDPACCTALGLMGYAAHCRLASPEPILAGWKGAVRRLRVALGRREEEPAGGARAWGREPADTRCSVPNT
jgi:cell division protein FtsA